MHANCLDVFSIFGSGFHWRFRVFATWLYICCLRLAQSVLTVRRTGTALENLFLSADTVVKNVWK